MKIKRHFTVFELLIAIVLLALLIIAMLRMFSATSDLWRACDEQSRLYADAKTAFAIISDDLNNILYQHGSICEPAGESDVTAPLWIEDYGISGAIDSYQSYDGSSTAGIHFITHNKFASVEDDDDGNKSGLYAVSYRFLPPSQNGQDWDNVFTADGVLARASLNASDVLDQAGTKSMGNLYTPDDDKFKQVVSGVLDFQIWAYQHVEPDDWDKTQTPLDLEDGSSQGAEDVETIVVVLTLMPPERIPELRKLLDQNNGNADADEVKEYLFQYSRTFSKTFRIRSRIGDEE